MEIITKAIKMPMDIATEQHALKMYAIV